MEGRIYRKMSFEPAVEERRSDTVMDGESGDER